VGDRQRRAVVCLPGDAAPAGPRPLVLTCHGSGSSAVEQLATSGLDEVGRRHGAVVVAPQGAVRTGIGWSWAVPGTPGAAAGPDDAAFLLALVDALVASGHADPHRVYATGFSGGARLACQLAADHPDRVAAVGAVAGLRAGPPDPADPGAPDPERGPTRAVPVIAFHGTADPVNPYAGGGAPYWGYPVAAALERWARLAGCPEPPTREDVAPGVARLAYETPDGDRPVQLYLAEGAGHTWPGTRAPVPPGMGAVAAIDAAALICAFLAARRVP
jgi:polyhydroxybutyrate depolymerase